MKVYLGWSGARGREVARAMELWLGGATAIELWSADNGLSAGSIAAATLHRQMPQTELAIICVAFEERGDDILLYQVGACVQALTNERGIGVYLCLLDVESDDLPAVLSSCMAVGVSRTGMTRLLLALGAVDGVDRSRVIDRWPSFDTTLEGVRQMVPKTTSTRREISEILALVRRLVQDRERGQLAAREDATSVARVTTAELDFGQSLAWDHSSAASSIALPASSSPDLDFDFTSPVELLTESTEMNAKAEVAVTAELASHASSNRPKVDPPDVDRTLLRSRIDGHRAELEQLEGKEPLRSVVRDLLLAFDDDAVADYRPLLGQSYRVLLARGEPIAPATNAWFEAIALTLKQVGL